MFVHMYVLGPLVPKPYSSIHPPAWTSGIYVYISIYLDFWYTYLHVYTRIQYSPCIVDVDTWSRCIDISVKSIQICMVEVDSTDIYMGWLQLVGSLKSKVSFAEYRLFYRPLLQKRPIILRSLLIVATP